MKLRKLISCVAASAVAVASFATTSSAVLVTLDTTGYFHSGTGSWMPVIYSDGTFDSADKPVTNYGIDCTKIGSVEVTFTPADKDWFDGSFGGAIVLSSKSESNADHNWNGKEYWGTIDEDLGIETLAADKAVIFEKVGDYLYKGVMTVDDTNCVYEGYQLVQIAVQEWGSDMSEIKVVSMVVKDTDGNEMISFDENGTASLPLVTDDAAAEEEAPAEEETTEEEAPAEEEEAPAEEVEEEEAPAEEAEEEEEAPAEEETTEEEAPAVEEAPAAGDVAGTTDSSKGSPDTGVEDVAVVAGLAIVAAGAVLVSKKRK